jgi:Putative Ig domain
VPLAVTTATLPAGTTGTAYSQALAATGGTPPDTWSLASGSLPRGLSLRGSGVIAGTPVIPGTYRFTVRVTDAAGTSATKALSITISRPKPPLAIITTRLAAGPTGRIYLQVLTAAGGVPPYTWSLASGSLPRGLALRRGVITGIPATTGTYEFTVRVTDRNGTTATKALSIRVNRR